MITETEIAPEAGAESSVRANKNPASPAETAATATAISSASGNANVNTNIGINAVASDESTAGDPVSDSVLLRRIQGGDGQAATELYDRYVNRLRALARSRCPSDLKPMVESVDIVQSALGSFFRRASRGDYDLPDGMELWSLLLVITLNKIKDAGTHHRSQKRDARRTQRINTDDWEQMLPQSRNNGGDDAQLEFLIDDLLGSLDSDRKTMVRMRIEGHTVEEIAKTLDRAKRTVERALQNVRIQLHQLLIETV